MDDCANYLPALPPARADFSFCALESCPGERISVPPSNVGGVKVWFTSKAKIRQPWWSCLSSSYLLSSPPCVCLCFLLASQQSLFCFNDNVCQFEMFDSSVLVTITPSLLVLTPGTEK